MGVTVKSTLSSKWVEATKQQLDSAVAEMATDIDRRAKILAPVDTRALVNSGRVARIAAAWYRVTFGSSKVPYARLRHFKNLKNPQTLGYLERAGDSVVRGNTDKYLRKR